MMTGGPTHPKILDLAQRLNVPRYVAVGIMESFWHWCGQYAPTGSLANRSPSAIAVGIGWDGDAQALLDAMRGARLLDQVRDDGVPYLAIHNWSRRCEKWIRTRLKRQGMVFWDGSEPFRKRGGAAENAGADPRDASASRRDENASQRDEKSSRRDASASHRDEVASRRDGKSQSGALPMPLSRTRNRKPEPEPMPEPNPKPGTGARTGATPAPETDATPVPSPAAEPPPTANAAAEPPEPDPSPPPQARSTAGPPSPTAQAGSEASTPGPSPSPSRSEGPRRTEPPALARGSPVPGPAPVAVPAKQALSERVLLANPDSPTRPAAPNPMTRARAIAVTLVNAFRIPSPNECPKGATRSRARSDRTDIDRNIAPAIVKALAGDPEIGNWIDGQRRASMSAERPLAAFRARLVEGGILERRED